MTSHASKIETWPIGRPIPYSQNPRVIPEKAIDAVALSIKTFGFLVPIVVDKAQVIITGHTRLLAAQSLGYTEVPVIVADLTEDQARAYRIADNRVADFTSWDFSDLIAELDALPTDFEEVLDIENWRAQIADFLDDHDDLTLEDDEPKQTTFTLTVEFVSEADRTAAEALLVGMDGIIKQSRATK